MRLSTPVAKALRNPLILHPAFPPCDEEGGAKEEAMMRFGRNWHGCVTRERSRCPRDPFGLPTVQTALHAAAVESGRAGQGAQSHFNAIR